MKKPLLILMLGVLAALPSAELCAQRVLSYTYDGAGNRTGVTRTMVGGLSAETGTAENNERMENCSVEDFSFDAPNLRLTAISQLDTSKAAGSLRIQETVSPSGARVIKVPIPSVKGLTLTPELSLVYNSQASYGEAGYGWSTGGLSAVTLRSGTRFYEDTATGADVNDTTQYFSLDDTPVVRSDKGVPGYELETVQGHILLHRRDGTDGLPVAFTALYPDGSRREYSSIAGRRHIFPVSTITDRYGNTIRFSYTYNGGTADVTSVEYGFSGSMQPLAKTTFTYKTRHNHRSIYFAGEDLRNSYLLSAVTVLSGTDTLQRWTLGHTLSNGVDLLTSISASGADGTSINPLTFTYGSGTQTADFQAPAQRTISPYFSIEPNRRQYRRGKFIAGEWSDGIAVFTADTTQLPEPARCIIVSHPSLSQAVVLPLGEHFLTAEAGDWDGDARDELVRINASGGNRTADTLTLTTFVLGSDASERDTTFTITIPKIFTSSGFVQTGRRYLFGDFLGDGTVKLLITSHPTEPTGTIISSPLVLVDLADCSRIFEQNINFTYASDAAKLMALDYNGDGAAELCMCAETGFKVYKLTRSGIVFDRTVSGYSSSVVPSSDFEPFFADVGGDGYPDIIFAPGQGTFESTWTVFTFDGHQYRSSTFSGFARKAGDGYLWMDVNRDGLSDLVQVNGSSVNFILNEEGTLSATNIRTSGQTVPSGSVIIPCNEVTFRRTSNFITVDGAEVRTYTFGENRGAARLMTTATDGNGLVRTAYYADIVYGAPVYSRDLSLAFNPEDGIRRLETSLKVVSTTLRHAPVTGLVGYTSYTYGDAVASTEGLGLLCFARQTCRDILAGQEVTSVNDPLKMGRPIRIERRLSAASESFETTVNTYDSHSTTYGRLNPRLTGSVVTDCLAGVRTTTSFTYIQYDLVRNISKVIVGISGTGPVITENRVCSYKNSLDTLKYFIGLPEYVTNSRYDSSSQSSVPDLHQTRYKYDSGPLLLVSVKEVIPGQSPVTVSETRFCYDAYGNVTRKAESDHGALLFRNTDYTYTDLGRRLASVTDPLGRTTSYSDYNRFGLPETATDYAGRVTSTTYDTFGRVTRVDRPDGSWSADSLAWSDVAVYKTISTSSDSPTVTTHYDAAGRVVRTDELRFDGGTAKTDISYNSIGKPVRVSLPYKGASAVKWNTKSYDAYGREVRDSLATGAVTTCAYNGLSSTTTKQGVAITRITDAAGGLISATDLGGTTTYLNDNAGRVVAVCGPQGDTTLITYDACGRRTMLVDSSSGTVTDSYTDNVDGTSSHTVTGANGSVTDCFDILGRLVSRAATGAGAFTATCSYDSSNGLLTGIASTNGYSVQYSYDSLDRVATVIETAPGGRRFRTQFCYAADGTTASRTYAEGAPASRQFGSITSEHYIWSNGVLTDVRMGSATGVSLRRLVSENDLGEPTSVLSIGTARSYSYTPAGLPTRRTLGTAMDVSYTWEGATSDMLSRSDNTRGKTETFAYDALDRLSQINGNHIRYNTAGGKTAEDGIGLYSYNTSTGKPCQMRELYGTDGGGDFPQSAVWSAYGRPVEITAASRADTLLYTPDGGRVCRRGGGSARYTFCGGRFEVDSTSAGLRKMLYLAGDAYSAPVVYVQDGGGSWIPHLLGRDVQGSITHVTTPGGTLEYEYSYDAWGRLRNPATWALYTFSTQPALWLGRGYTGHEHLQWCGLVNMNARLYDPWTGSFTSPDPFVQAPDFSQSLNRYAYCLNNPLKYTDESGEWAHIIIGALLGGVGNLIANWDDCEGFWEYLASFAVGAAGGAAVAATGGAAAAAGGGFWATASVIGLGTIGGAINGATGEIISQTGSNFKGLSMVDWSSVGNRAIANGIAGGVGAGIGVAMSSANISIKIKGTAIKSPFVSSFIIGSATGSAGHIAGGTISGLVRGDSFKEAFLNSFNGLSISALTGGVFATVSTAAINLANGINPLNGDPLSSRWVTAKDLGIEGEVARIRNGIKYGQFRHDGTTFSNYEGYLPEGVSYTEYVSPITSGSGPGAARIVVGGDNTWYYTPDHYKTFFRFKP